jgi:hypothetical protein
MIVGGYRDGENGQPSPSIEIFNYNANTVKTLLQAGRGGGVWDSGFGVYS